jgi:hypothetical protein
MTEKETSQREIAALLRKKYANLTTLMNLLGWRMEIAPAQDGISSFVKYLSPENELLIMVDDLDKSFRLLERKKDMLNTLYYYCIHPSIRTVSHLLSALEDRGYKLIK